MAERPDYLEHAPRAEEGAREDDLATVDPVEQPHHAESLEAYMHTISTKPLLSAAEEKRLARRVQAGCSRAKDELVQRNLRLVVYNARRFRGLGLEFEELIQEGTLGLIRAAEKFDPSKGYKFSTYATWWIRQKAGRAVMDKSRSVRIPVHYQESLRKLGQAENRLSATLGREPTTGELAEHLEVSARKARELLYHRRPVVSLDAPVTGSEDGGADDRDAPGVVSFVADEEQAGEAARMAEQSFEHGSLARSLAELPDGQRFIIERRYGLCGGPIWTLEALADELSIHREAVRKQQKRAELNLRGRMADHSSRNISEGSQVDE